MATIKTSELTGPALDWAVAKCKDYNEIRVFGKSRPSDRGWIEVRFNPEPKAATARFDPSENWSQGGPISEREGINAFKYNKLNDNEPDLWCAHKIVPRKNMEGLEYSAALSLDGPTELVAKMRCYVASKMGDTVEVPDELL